MLEFLARRIFRLIFSLLGLTVILFALTRLTPVDPVRYVLGFVFQLFAGLIFSSLGGLLGAIFFRRDVPPAPGGDAIVPPPIPE